MVTGSDFEKKKENSSTAEELLLLKLEFNSSCELYLVLSTQTNIHCILLEQASCFLLPLGSRAHGYSQLVLNANTLNLDVLILG